MREGLTNVVRHARASCCTVRLSRSAVEIVDDSTSEPAPEGGVPPGNGLSGLRERAAAAGGRVDAGPLQAGGWQRRAMESGACGFVVKDAPPEQLADAIRRVAAGQRVVDPALAATTLAAGASPLTARERDVLVAARPGATVAEIADKLFLSEGTVRNYLSAAIAKTGTRNRAEAVRAADQHGWL